MKVCCCFGNNRTYSKNDIEKVEQEILNVILNHKITVFHVVCEGEFGLICAKIIQKYKQQFPNLKCFRILAYLNNYTNPDLKIYGTEFNKNFDGTIFPDIENVPKRFSIIKRNQIMVNYSSYIIFFCNYRGNISKLVSYATTKKKKFSVISSSI